MPGLHIVAENHYEEFIQNNSSQSSQPMRTISEIATACNVWFLS